jgi:hypothetical protein
VSEELPPDVVRWLEQRGGGASRADLLGRRLTSVDLARYTRRGLLTRVRRGYYVLGAASSQSDQTDLDAHQRQSRDHVRAASSLSRPDQVAALRTGALVWNLPVSCVPPKPELIRAPGSSRPAGTRVRFADLGDQHVVRHRGIWVTSLVRTAVDLALDLPEPESLITLDAALPRGVGRSSLLTHLAERGAVRHARRARRAIEWADRHSESPLESRCRGELLLDGVPRPECNLRLRFDGREIRPDLLWRELGIVVEVDGRGKYDRPDVLWQEKRRQDWMESELGLIVLRMTHDEIVGDPRDCARRWRAAERRRINSPWQRPHLLEFEVRTSR